jgi:ABC-2 type transport system ATP-binding protein
MLAIDGLSKTYRNSDAPALRGVSFSVRPGGFSALLGPNGAGKSTLINILAGRVEPDAGTIGIAGEELRPGRPRLRALIGIVPQEIRFDFVFTVEELLRLERGFYGLARDEAHIQYLLERLALADKRRARVRALSGGMLRRLMIARALVHHPRLLLLDEPTAGVDLHLRRDMYAFLRELNASGTTIVLTTHYLEEAEELCEQVIVLDHGRVVADEPRDAFLRLAGDFLTVTITTSVADRLRPFFEASGGTPLADTADGLRFVFPGAQREVLLSRLSEAAPHIDSFEILKPKLEEVFARLTEKEVQSHAQLN